MNREYLISAAYKRVWPLALRFGADSPQVARTIRTWGALIDKAEREEVAA